MKKIIRVLKSLRKMNFMVKLAHNRNIVTQLPLHTELTNLPITVVDYKAACDDGDKEYQLHLTGDREATKRMYEAEGTLDLYYSSTAAYVETVANQNNDPALPISLGFELYAERKPRAPKLVTARDGNDAGDIYVEYPKLQYAGAYISKIAEVIAGQEPVYTVAQSCTITLMVIHHCKPNTKYLICVAGVFASGIGPYSNPITFRTKE
ncbi:MAG: fibronectin type III domain-containing protein [Bacteroidota bacterium]